jgi:hypothetical protein
MTRGLIGFGFAMALGLAGLSGAAQAMPIPGESGPGASGITLVAQGCGPGMHRGPYGGCRPNYGPRGYGPPRAYGPPRRVGPGCIMQRTPYGMRRICRY